MIEVLAGFAVLILLLMAGIWAQRKTINGLREDYQRMEYKFNALKKVNDAMKKLEKSQNSRREEYEKTISNRSYFESNG